MKITSTGPRCRTIGSLGRALLLFSMAGFLPVPPPLHAENDSEDWVSSIREANKASLVFISGNVKYNNGLVKRFAGTGFIVGPAGYVLTCYHVIPEFDPDVDTFAALGIVGRRYGNEYPLSIVDRDKQHDVMLLTLPQEQEWPSVRSSAKWQLDSEIVVFGISYGQATAGRAWSHHRRRN